MEAEDEMEDDAEKNEATEIAVKGRFRKINKFAKILPAIKGRVWWEVPANVRAHDVTNSVNTDLDLEAEISSCYRA